MRCLQAQTLEEWICEVRDDCPDGSARAVVEQLGDPRIHYVGNKPQKFMVRNLDDCFLRENAYGADYFFMLEDDNQVRPEIMARGAEIIEQAGVTICQLNQVIEHRGVAGEGRIDDTGVFDELYAERVHAPEERHLGMFGAVGISNGALFWSRHIRRELALGIETLPTLEEYLRTRLVGEPIYISREKLAVWSKDEELTQRNAGVGKSWLRR